MTGWELVESGRADRTHAAFGQYETAVGFLILRVDQLRREGWRATEFHEGPPPWLRMRKGKIRITLEVKRQVR